MNEEAPKEIVNGRCKSGEYYQGRIWINDMDRQTNEIATHWMPLPTPPPRKNEGMD